MFLCLDFIIACYVLRWVHMYVHGAFVAGACSMCLLIMANAFSESMYNCAFISTGALGICPRCVLHEDNGFRNAVQTVQSARYSHLCPGL